MIDAIGIVTKDIDKSLSFYRLLGIDLKEYGNEGHFEGSSGSIRVMLDTFELMKKINPDFEMASGSKTSFCFKFQTIKELDDMFSRIKEDKHRILKEPWDAFWGQRYAIVYDPSGNQIDLFCEVES